MRTIPDIKLREIEGYAKVLARGFDTVKETFNMQVPDSLIERLDAEKKRLSEDENSAGDIITFGDEQLKLSPYGTRSALYVLGNDDFTIFLRSPKMEWCVSVEYRSAGLWEYGLEKLRDRALKCLFKEMKPIPHKDCVYGLDDARSWQRVSIIHWAFDFYSPEFSKEMRPAILEQIFCPSATKKSGQGIEYGAFGKGNSLETLTIGKKNNLQVQVYNKGKEIKDTNGKTWMFDLWARSGWQLPDDGHAVDVWRLEFRYGSEFLKNRGLLTLDEALEELPAILTEGIFTRRLSDKVASDSNRSRWPMHALWVAAYKEIGEGYPFMLPLGKQSTTTIEAKAAALKKTTAGNLRALAIMTCGDVDDLTAINLIAECYDMMKYDPDGKRKTDRCITRYFFANEAA